MTVDAKHKELEQQQIQKASRLPALQKNLIIVTESIQKIESKQVSEKKVSDYSTLHILRLKLTEISSHIQQLTSQADVTEYDLNTGRMRIDYHSIDNNTTRTRGQLYEEYMKYITDGGSVMSLERVKNDDTDSLCKDCNVKCRLSLATAHLVCPECGLANSYIDNELNPPSYKELEQKNMTQTCGYQRRNHFTEWLSQFQARETTDIPTEVFELIARELKKQKKILHVSKLKPEGTKDILKKLGLNKYYEHVPYILCTMYGQRPPCMDPSTESMLKVMFQDIQIPFGVHCPETRTNFLSYSYVIHKCCELLGLDDYLVYFPLLKSQDKLREQDCIWKLICADLRWQYFPSL